MNQNERPCPACGSTVNINALACWACTHEIAFEARPWELSAALHQGMSVGAVLGAAACLFGFFVFDIPFSPWDLLLILGGGYWGGQWNRDRVKRKLDGVPRYWPRR